MLTEWLLGEEEPADQAPSEESSGLVRNTLDTDGSGFKNDVSSVSMDVDAELNGKVHQEGLNFHLCVKTNQAEEDFLFEKGNLNLWAEPLQWAKTLHEHLRDLIGGSGLVSCDVDRVQALSRRARAQELSSQQALDHLPGLPQFSCTMEHSRLTLLQQRASLALDVLHRLS